ncbi:MAG TPA: M23 family metallopeptidase [Gemmatimonadales bacterium]|nr:M23 family metallopeptidase [Gemmatimonadales bacterium]
MAKRRWTIVLVPHDAEPSRVIELSYGLIKGACVALVTLVGCALLVGYATVSRRVDLSRAARLESENAKLAQALGDIHGRLSTLTDTLAEISRRDARIRVLANLEPIDPQVLAAGIGGPVMPPSPDASPLERHTMDVRVDVNALIRRANLLASSFRVAADSLASHTERLAATPSIMPTEGWLSSAFQSMRAHPILHIARPHEGIDVSAPSGSPIEAPAAGRVIAAGWEQGYGNTLEIDHGYGITTRYAHASRLLVKKGDRVKRGQRIALVGNSGLATGPHLHYEVHVNGKPVNPLRYVMPEAVVTD